MVCAKSYYALVPIFLQSWNPLIVWGQRHGRGGKLEETVPGKVHKWQRNRAHDDIKINYHMTKENFLEGVNKPRVSIMGRRMRDRQHHHRNQNGVPPRSVVRRSSIDTRSSVALNMHKLDMTTRIATTDDSDIRPTSDAVVQTDQSYSCLCHRKWDVQSFSTLPGVSGEHSVGEEVEAEGAGDGGTCNMDDDGYYNGEETAVMTAVMKNGIWRTPDYEGFEGSPNKLYKPQTVHCSEMKEDAEAKIQSVVNAFDPDGHCILEGYGSDECEKDMRNAEALQESLFVLGFFKHAFHVYTRSWMGWKFNDYLHLTEEERNECYGQKLFEDLVDAYMSLSAGKCCDTYKESHQKYLLLHDRRGLGGVYPGTLDQPGGGELSEIASKSLGCCPAQCEPQVKECSVSNTWYDPFERNFAGDSTGKEDFSVESG